MKRKYIVAALMMSLGISALASQSDDLKFIDELYKQKKFETAIGESKDFMDRYPESKYNRRLIDRIAKVYFLQDNYEEAIKYFRMLLLNEDIGSKEKDEINYYLAKAYASLGNEAGSEEYLNSINPKSNYYEKAILDTGTIYLEKENYARASSSFEKLMTEHGKYYNDAILNMALLSYNKKQYAKAVEYISQYVRESGKKDNPFMNYLLGSAYYKLNDINSAVQTFNNMIANDKLNDHSQKAILNLIEIYSNLGDVANAEEKLKLITKPSYKNDGIRIIGDSFATNKNYEKAIEYYSQIKDLSNPKLLYSYGVSLFKLENYKDALVYFESLKNSSLYDQALYYIFASDYKLKDYKKILKNSDKLGRLKVDAKDMESINLIIANSAYELGKYKLSRDYYGRMYAANPNAENLYRIIIIDNKLEDLEDMQLRFNEYRRKFSGSGAQKKNIYLAMGELLYKKGKVDQAIEVYEEYLEKSKNFDILNNLITAFLTAQRYDEMVEYLEKTEDTTNNKFLKGVAYLGMGKYPEADAIFVELESNPEITPEFAEKLKINKIRSNFLQNKYQEAIEGSKEYLLAYPDSKNSGEALDKMAISYFRLDDFDSSREIYEKLKELPEYAEYAQFQIADSYYAQKNYEKAVEYYSLVGATYPNGKYTESANYWFLNSLVNLKQFAQFEVDKEAFLEKYPNTTMRDSLLILSSQIYESAGDRAKLLENYKTLFETTKSNKTKQEIATKIIEMQLADNNLEEAAKNIEIIENEETKAYFNSIVLEKTGKLEEAKAEYEKLVTGDKYKDYAGMKLATYYFHNKDYAKAKEYYEMIDALENTQYKDLVLLQLGFIDESQGENESAYRRFTKGYVLYDGQYSDVSKFKAAQLAEKLNKDSESEKLYRELYNLPEFKFRTFVLEKLIYFSLKKENKVEAKKYYTELQAADPAAAEKYTQFFN